MEKIKIKIEIGIVVLLLFVAHASATVTYTGTSVTTDDSSFTIDFDDNWMDINNMTIDNVSSGNITATGDLDVTGNIYVDGITVMGSDGFLVSPTDTGASIRLNITQGGDIYTEGTWTNDGSIRQAGTYWLYNTIGLLYPHVHMSSTGLEVYDGTVAENVVINLTNEGVITTQGLEINGTVDRWFNDSSDNIDTFIRNSNGNYWIATGANLQLAIWDLNSTDGGEVQLPEGTTPLPEIVHMRDNVTLTGTGMYSTILSISGTEHIGLDLNGTTKCHIRDLTIDGNNDTITYTNPSTEHPHYPSSAPISGICFHHGANNCKVENVLLKECADALQVANGHDIDIINCRSDNNSYVAISIGTYVSGNPSYRIKILGGTYNGDDWGALEIFNGIDTNSITNNITIESATFVGNGITRGRGQIHILDSESITVRNCEFQDSLYGIHLEQYSYAYHFKGYQFIGLKTYNVGSGIMIGATTVFVNISNILITGCEHYNGNYFCYLSDEDGAMIHNVSITSCLWRDVGSEGIEAGDCRSIIVNGCIGSGANSGISGWDNDYWLISDNIFVGHASSITRNGGNDVIADNIDA